MIIDKIMGKTIEAVGRTNASLSNALQKKMGKAAPQGKDAIGNLPGTTVPYRNDRQRLNQY